MNRTAIEWTDFTWNPITGCSRGCVYCYARRLAEGRLRGRYGYNQDEPFAVTWHPNRLIEPIKRRKGAKIFTCSMGEMFDPQVNPFWANMIFKVMRAVPRHTFQVLTKQPQNVLDRHFIIPHNCWLGISQDGRYTDDLAFHYLLNIEAKTKFVSFEPLLGEISDLETNLCGIDWVIIGARTGSGAVPPQKVWVENIIGAARDYDIPIFLKDNLHWPEQIREWPKGAEQ